MRFKRVEKRTGAYTCDYAPTYRVAPKPVLASVPLVKVKTITDDPNIFWIVCGNFEAPVCDDEGNGIYDLKQAKAIARGLFSEKEYTIFNKTTGEKYTKTIKSKKTEETING